jgi:hypothetical protein
MLKMFARHVRRQFLFVGLFDSHGRNEKTARRRLFDGHLTDKRYLSNEILAGAILGVYACEGLSENATRSNEIALQLSDSVLMLSVVVARQACPDS